MNPIVVLLAIAGYFAVLLTISYFTSRKTDNKTFFQGTRKTPWYLIAFAMIGSGMTGVTFISVPGWVATTNFAYLQMALGFIVGQLVVAYVLIPLYYKLNLISIYEYLGDRLGGGSYKSGAWIFFISKMLSSAIRLFLICMVLQSLVFEPLNLPFSLNIISSMLLVWLFTFQGGVKTVIWSDILKTFCLITVIILSIYFIASSLDLNFGGVVSTIKNSDYTRVFFFDDVNDKRFFPKQFLAGVFTVIATIGLDQDMMQRALSSKNFKESQRNMFISSLFQFVVIAFFLFLGVMLYTFAFAENLNIPVKSDEVFPMIATQGYLPLVVGLLFVIGLVSSTYTSAGSALTSLTTSFTVDILNMKDTGEKKLRRIIKIVHIGMAVVMGLTVIIFKYLNNTNVIDAYYVMASYTYGPIVGLFAFGLFTKRNIRDKWVPIVCILSPLICFILDKNSTEWFGGYQFSYEILIINALFTFIGCWALTKPGKGLSKV